MIYNRFKYYTKAYIIHCPPIINILKKKKRKWRLISTTTTPNTNKNIQSSSSSSFNGTFCIVNIYIYFGGGDG